PPPLGRRKNLILERNQSRRSDGWRGKAFGSTYREKDRLAGMIVSPGGGHNPSQGHRFVQFGPAG
ncbi:hypothetical protein, partial [Methylobacterium sp. WL2]|uniref:hypothetical protein n=1 Tax=Methylobacterium sp. WL2 TaxID=2603902 RepID=UPI001AED7F26